MFLSHHVKSMRNGCIHADGEVVVNYVAGNWIGAFRDGSVGLIEVDRRRRTELDLPPVHQHNVALTDHL